MQPSKFPERDPRNLDPNRKNTHSNFERLSSSQKILTISELQARFKLRLLAAITIFISALYSGV